MNFKELFDKEFLFESKKEDNKTTKIFYKFDINIKKIEEQNQQDPNQANAQQPTDQNNMQNTADANAAAPMPDNPPPMDGTISATPAAPTQDLNAAPQADASGVLPMPDNPPPMFSVVTEDDNDIKVNDENNIIRKMEGEVVLTKEEIDDIQTVEDLLTKLTDAKVDGVNVLDEFTADILQTASNPATQMQLKEKIDKESNIFAEVLYGKKKDNSIGFRIIKRKNSDLLTSSMMIDNKIINSQFKKEILDKRITDYRNDEYEDNK